MGLVPATIRRYQSHRVNWPFLLQNLVAGTTFWSLSLDFVAKMARSHDATSPCDLLQGLAPTCVLTLMLKTLRCTHLLQLFLPDIYGTDQHGEI